MKKFTALAAALALILTALTACGNTPEQTPSESTGETSTSTSESALESSSDSELESSVVPVAHTAKMPDNFNLSDYITDFDDVTISKCSAMESSLYGKADDTAVAKAIEIYEQSDYYREALEAANDLYHFENGELTENDDSVGWIKIGYKGYIVQPEASELTFQPIVAKSLKFKLDGENEENLVLLMVPLPLSATCWTGHANFCVPVYVNSLGEARILSSACSQDYSEFSIITIGSTNALLCNFGHNDGGAHGAFYTFKDGAPKLEFYINGHTTTDSEGNFFVSGLGESKCVPFFWNADTETFCGLEAVIPDEELAEIICSDKTVSDTVPDAWEKYLDGKLAVIGGRYISFDFDNRNVETFEAAPDGLVRSDINVMSGDILLTSQSGGKLPDTVDALYNIKL